MRRVRVFIIVLVLAWSGFALPTGARGQDSLVGTGGDPVLVRSPDGTSPFVGQSSRGSCTVDSDCDDRDGCTADTCDQDLCDYAPITDCIACASTYDCPLIDLVFVMDTSGSMRDEGAALCATIDDIVAELSVLNLTIDVTILGITETPGDAFSCLTDSVSALLCDPVPCDSSSCPFPGNPSSYESWGPATAIVAERFDWEPGANRLIVPMSDEGPCNGDQPDGCNDPGDDRNSIVDAIARANLNNVTVSPITGTDAGDCTKFLAEVLAAGTQGTAVHMEDPLTEFSSALRQVILGTCIEDATCDDLDPCTSNDTCTDQACEGKPISGCQQCIDANDCDDGDLCTEDVCVNSQCVFNNNFDDVLDCCDPATGQLIALDDQNECTQDVCDPSTGLVAHPFETAGTPCDDGIFCNGTDTCFSGTCSMHTGNPCIGGSECANSCDEDARTCNLAAGTACTDDGDECTDDECDGDGNCIGVYNTQPCDDGFYCTVGETCMNGVCAGGQPRDCSALDTQCEIGVCIGELQQCNTKPLVGEPCDDGDVCTTDDYCDNKGECTGTFVDIPICHPEPKLCLKAERDCLRPGEEFTVNVTLSPSIHVIVGGGFSIGFDPTAFQVLEVDPGGIVDPLSPFRIETIQLIDNTRGTVLYGVGIGAGDTGTNGPAVMAVLRVRALASCTVTQPFCFLQGNPVGTSLTNAEGEPVPFIPCCSANLTLGGDPVVLTCPGDVSMNADAGGVTAYVTWDPPSFSGGCPGGIQTLVCSATNEFDASVDHLIQAGGLLPTGLTYFQCEVVDACGVVSSCAWVVQVNRLNPVEVHLQLSPIVFGVNGLTRCIEFTFFSSCVEPPVRIAEVIEFGGPFNLPGHADHVLFKVPAGKYVCMTARDPLHTLRSTALLQIVNGRYTAEFRGDPFFGGNWLINGNLNGDHVIDILDFGMLISGQFLTSTDPNTTCDTQGPHADFDGNGIVDELDFSFISLNFLALDKNACCSGSVASTDGTGIMEVSLQQLYAKGLGHLRVADLNGDGMLNLSDVSALLQGSVNPKSSRKRPKLVPRQGRPPLVPR